MVYTFQHTKTVHKTQNIKSKMHNSRVRDFYLQQMQLSEEERRVHLIQVQMLQQAATGTKTNWLCYSTGSLFHYVQ